MLEQKACWHNYQDSLPVCFSSLTVFPSIYPLHLPLLSLSISLYLAPLFIPLALISSLLDFSLPAPVPCASLSTSPSASIFTRLCDMTGGPVNSNFDRCRWVWDAELFATAFLHAAFSTDRFIVDQGLLLISLCKSFLPYTCWFIFFRVYLWGKCLPSYS